MVDDEAFQYGRRRHWYVDEGVGWCKWKRSGDLLQLFYTNVLCVVDDTRNVL